MSESQNTTTQLNGSLRKRKSYKKVERSNTRHIRGLLRLQSFILDAIDDLAVELFTEITGCQLCSQFLVMTARNSCCEPCLTEWINEIDDDEEIIECRMCGRPIKTVLSGRELKIFCELVELNDKKIRENGHFGYPVLSNEAMDQLFEDIEDRPALPNLPNIRMSFSDVLN